MDAVAALAAMVPKKNANHPVVSIFPNLMRRMEHAPRFLIDNGAIAAVVEITLGRPKILREAMAHLIVPYERMWVEWEEAGRERIRSVFEGAITPDRPLPVRVGFLLETKPGGRKGIITWAWNTPYAVDCPNISPISAYFDLDADFRQSNQRIEGLLGGNIAKLWEGNAVQLDALFGIWRTAEHLPSNWGADWLEYVTNTPEELDERIGNCFADVYGEYICVWALLMLLTASKTAVDLRPVDRSKLNRIRAKKRATPLLDHTEVVLHVQRRPDGTALPRAPLGHARKSPRIHMVSRYLARRGDKHWIVEPYLRGSGGHVERHVHVRQ
jgi:hypothetical protein